MTLPTGDLQFTVSIRSNVHGKPYQREFDRLRKDIGGLFTKKRKSVAFKVSRQNARASLKALEKQVREETDSITDGTMRAVERVLNKIKTDAVRITPKDTGLLRKSAFVAVERTKHRIRGRVGYEIISGPIPPGVAVGAFYSVWVHENMEMSHKAPTQALFLQSTLDAWHHRILNDIKSEIQKRRK